MKRKKIRPKNTADYENGEAELRIAGAENDNLSCRPERPKDKMKGSRRERISCKFNLRNREG